MFVIPGPSHEVVVIAVQDAGAMENAADHSNAKKSHEADVFPRAKGLLDKLSTIVDNPGPQNSAVRPIQTHARTSCKGYLARESLRK